MPAPNPLKSLKTTYNINPAFGGPIKKDKLWFFVAANRTRHATYIAVQPNKNAGNPNAWLYVPDPGAEFPAIDIKFWGENGRLTWQATPKNKFAFHFDTQVRCSCPQGGANQAPEAQPERKLPVTRLATLVYTAPISNSVVLDFAVMDRLEPALTTSALHIPLDIIPVTDQGLGLQYRNYFNESGGSDPAKNKNWRGSVSLVTGAHAMKVGFTGLVSSNRQTADIGPNQVRYQFRDGVPNQVTVFAGPTVLLTDSSEFGLFVQDRWTVKRLTLTGGLRYDDYRTSFPDQTLGPVLMAPTRNVSFPAHDGAKLKDLSYRMGGAVDVFGNGRTAVKVSLNKYLAAMNTGSGGIDYNFGRRLNPVSLVAPSANRSWNDSFFPVGDPRRGNFVPDCVLSQLSANGECGAMSNQSFGLPVVSNTYDPDLKENFNRRLQNWEFTAGVQQQVLDRLALEFTYFRRWYGNNITTDNRAVAPSDFTAFSIVAPVDSRLPAETSGATLTGLYDVSQAKFGQTDNFTTFASNYGDVTRRWHGFDLVASVRALRGLTFQGGFSTGSTFQDNCPLKQTLPEYDRPLSIPFLPTNPTDPWCTFTTDWLHQFKGMGSYTVPRIDVQASLGFQSMAGPELAADYTATNAVTLPSLGRPLSGGKANVPVNLIQPGTFYGERMNTVDLRLGKILRFAGRGKAAVSMDLYNMFNVDTVLIENETYSPTATGPSAWRAPRTVIAGRLIKFGVQFDF